MPLLHYRKYSLGRHMSKHGAKGKGKVASKVVSKVTSKIKSIGRTGARSITTSKKSGVQSIVMKEGTLLFHGHPEAKEWVVPHNRPAFFGGTMVALYYANDQPDYVSTYVLKRNVRLLDLGSPRNYGKFYKTLKNESEKWTFSRVTGYNLSELATESCGYRRKKKSDIRFCTEDFIEPEDEQQDNYAMLRFAKTICDHGFDGYYIPPVFKRAYEKRTKSQDEFLTEQIILCSPRDLVLKVSQLSIKSIATNMQKSRSKRKSRKSRK